MTIEKMRQELINFYDAAGQTQFVEQVQNMNSEDIQKHFTKMIEDEAYDKARNRLDEGTVEKEFEQRKARGKKV